MCTILFSFALPCTKSSYFSFALPSTKSSYYSLALPCTKSDYLCTGNVYQLAKNPFTFIKVTGTTMHEIWSLPLCITLNKIRLLYLQVMCTSLQKILPLSYRQTMRTTMHNVLSVLLIASFQTSVERRAVVLFNASFKCCL